jgi:sec-independent protein translocase protein TatB
VRREEERVSFFDIGSGEFLVIAIVALLLIGPDRLPRALSEGMRWLRALRDQAAKARGDIMDAASLDPKITEDLRSTLNGIGELHPKRIAASFITDSVDATPPRATPVDAPVERPAPNRPSGPLEPPARPTPSFDPDAT